MVDVTAVDDLVTWLREAVEEQHAESMADVAELGGWMEIYDPKRPTDEALAAVLLAEVEAKRARIDLLADAPEYVGESLGAAAWILSGLGLGAGVALMGLQMLLDVW